MAILFVSGILLFSMGALFSIALKRFPLVSLYLVHSLTGLGSLVWLASSVLGLSHHTLQWSLSGPLPFINWTVNMDGLAAFFILILSMVALFASMFAPGYLKSYIHRKNLWFLLMGLNLFILSMGLVLTAGDGWSFLFFWEAMALTSFFLVMFEHEEKKNRLAGFIYLVMTHIGTAFIIALFLILRTRTGSLEFAAMREHMAQVPIYLKNLIFVMAVIGFGTKAGIAPLHIWLPRAHPAAPSHISALMSGVMVKTAIYAFIRLNFDLLGGGPAWWGLVIVLIGLVTSLLGVLYALVEQNLKKMLAYSSVENIGIIFLAIGAALYLQSAGKTVLSLLALSAALIHSFNHALFKSLLFLGVGAVQQQTHTRNVEKLGGLIRCMPWTAAFFLIGSLAISAMPFTNGFIGEWRTLQGLLSMGIVPSDPLLRMVGPVAAAGLALTGGLAAACFVKAFGVSFLALPRSEAAKEAREASKGMLFAMGSLSTLCLATGIVPGLIESLIRPALQAIGLSYPHDELWRMAGGRYAFGEIQPVSLIIMASIVGIGGWLAVRLLAGKNSVRRAETWACGVTLQSQMEYTGISFTQPLRRVFSAILRPRRVVKAEHEQSPYFVTKISYQSVIPSLIEERLYQPAGRFFLGLANGIRRLQSGSLQLYLAYVLITLIFLLVFSGRLHP